MKASRLGIWKAVRSVSGKKERSSNLELFDGSSCPEEIADNLNEKFSYEFTQLTLTDKAVLPIAISCNCWRVLTFAPAVSSSTLSLSRSLDLLRVLTPSFILFSSRCSPAFGGALGFPSSHLFFRQIPDFHFFVSFVHGSFSPVSSAYGRASA